jgi:hypothetical protein
MVAHDTSVKIPLPNIHIYRGTFRKVPGTSGHYAYLMVLVHLHAGRPVEGCYLPWRIYRTFILKYSIYKKVRIIMKQQLRHPPWEKSLLEFQKSVTF